MKTKEKNEEKIDTIKMSRAIKAKISNEMHGLTFGELRAYLDNGREKLYATPNAVNAAPDGPNTREN